MHKQHLKKHYRTYRSIGRYPFFRWGYYVDCLDNRFKYYVRFNYFRRMKTTQERRENDFFDNYDEDAKEYKIKFRRARSKKYIPTAWEDKGTRGVKSWKDVTKHRKQWMVNL